MIFTPIIRSDHENNEHRSIPAPKSLPVPEWINDNDHKHPMIVAYDKGLRIVNSINSKYQLLAFWKWCVFFYEKYGVNKYYYDLYDRWHEKFDLFKEEK